MWEGGQERRAQDRTAQDRMWEGGREDSWDVSEDREMAVAMAGRGGHNSFLFPLTSINTGLASTPCLHLQSSGRCRIKYRNQNEIEQYQYVREAHVVTGTVNHCVGTHTHFLWADWSNPTNRQWSRSCMKAWSWSHLQLSVHNLQSELDSLSIMH